MLRVHMGFSRASAACSIHVGHSSSERVGNASFQLLAAVCQAMSDTLQLMVVYIHVVCGVLCHRQRPGTTLSCAPSATRLPTAKTTGARSKCRWAVMRCVMLLSAIIPSI